MFENLKRWWAEMQIKLSAKTEEVKVKAEEAKENIEYKYDAYQAEEKADNRLEEAQKRVEIAEDNARVQATLDTPTSTSADVPMTTYLNDRVEPGYTAENFTSPVTPSIVEAKEELAKAEVAHTAAKQKKKRAKQKKIL
jgi:hypothetical protein